MTGVIAGLLQAVGILSLVGGGLFLMVSSSRTNGFNTGLPVLIGGVVSALLFFAIAEVITILGESRAYHRRSMIALEQLLKLKQAELAPSRPPRPPRSRTESPNDLLDELN